ncbi:Protein ARV [Aphelenchoides bicaudatus]|nr:Protein ARV [Aphelenchoides bicaudatus]
MQEELVCVNCGAKASKLYIQYEKDVIKLTTCDKCKQITDKYVEYDRVLIFIDLILQYLQAYRHLFKNVTYESYWRVIIVFTMFSAYQKWTHERSSLPDLKLVYELEWQFYKSLLESASEIVVYSIVVLLLTQAFGHKIPNTKKFLCTTMCGFYGNFLMVFTIIWNLHDQLPFVLAIQAFLIISHIQVQRVLCPKRGSFLAFVTVLIATIVQWQSGIISKQVIQHFTSSF